jgi:hypothetical protein
VKRIKVHRGQSLQDICKQEFGGLDPLVDLAKLNNMAPTEIPQPGSQVLIDESLIVNQEVVDNYTKEGVRPNSGVKFDYVANNNNNCYFPPGYAPTGYVICPTNPVNVPSKITGLSYQIVNNQVLLSWDADAKSTQYIIEKDGAYLDTVPGTQLTFSDSNVVLGNTYEYTVRGVADVEGAKSDVLSVTVANQALPIITGLSASVISSSQIDLSWNAINGVDYYLIDIDGSLFVSVTNNYSHTNLGAETTHNYKVAYVSAGVQSPFTSVVTETTDALPDLFFDVFPPTQDVFNFTFFKRKSSYNGACCRVIIPSTMQEYDIDFKNNYIDLDQLNDLRGSAEVLLIRAYNQVVIGRDFQSSVSEAIPLTDGSGNLNLDANGFLYIDPSNAGHTTQFRVESITNSSGDGNVRGTFISVHKDTGATGIERHIVGRRPWFTTDNLTNGYIWGKARNAERKDITITGIEGQDVILGMHFNASGIASRLYIGKSLKDSEDFSDESLSNINSLNIGEDPAGSGRTWNSPIYEIIYFLDNKEVDWDDIVDYLTADYPQL